MRPDLDKYSPFNTRITEPVADETALSQVPPKLRKNGGFVVVESGPEEYVWLAGRRDMPTPGKVIVPVDVAASAAYLADPTSAAAAGRWIISAIAAILTASNNFKTSVAAVAVANLAGARSGNVITESAANGALGAIDGYTAVVGDRLLLTAQSAGADNGIYTVTAVGSGSAKWVLTRATDADSSAEIVDDFQVLVLNGTVYGGKIWMVHVGAAITLNTTALTFYRVAQTGLITLSSGVATGPFGVVITADSNVVYEPTTPGGTMGIALKTTYTDGGLGVGTFSVASLQTNGTTQTSDTSTYRYTVLN